MVLSSKSWNLARYGQWDSPKHNIDRLIFQLPHIMIKQTYSIGNIDYTLTRITGKFALYAGRHQKTKRRICYELVMLPNTGNPNLSQEEKDSSSFPALSSGDWGKQGWTFTDMTRADAMLRLFEEKAAA